MKKEPNDLPSFLRPDPPPPPPKRYLPMSGEKSANDIQPGGNHYRNKPIQPWDFIIANGIGFLEGNAIKYLCRWREKGGLQDLEKARHYVDKLIEVEHERIENNRS